MTLYEQVQLWNIKRRDKQAALESLIDKSLHERMELGYYEELSQADVTPTHMCLEHTLTPDNNQHMRRANE